MQQGSEGFGKLWSFVDLPWPSRARLGELEMAMAWSCAAAKMNSAAGAAGRLRCAALQAPFADATKLIDVDVQLMLS